MVQSPAPRCQHHRHLSEKELVAFWRKLDEQGAHVTTIAASMLLMLTMTRKSELLRSKWPEFDLDAAQWDLPAERMKMGKPHRVFLSRQAVTIFRQVHELTGHGEYVFPSIFRGSDPATTVTPSGSSTSTAGARLPQGAHGAATASLPLDLTVPTRSGLLMAGIDSLGAVLREPKPGAIASRPRLDRRCTSATLGATGSGPRAGG